MGFLEKLPEGETNLPTTVKDLGEQVVKAGQKTGENSARASLMS